MKKEIKKSNAGRKPVPNKKVQVSLYVPTSQIEKFEILPPIIKAGGKREGSGAKPKYSEKTKTIAFRCPISKVDELKLIVKSKLSNWSVK